MKKTRYTKEQIAFALKYAFPESAFSWHPVSGVDGQ